MLRATKIKRLISILSIILIIFLYWLFRFPLNRQVNMVMTYNKTITTISKIDDKYYMLLKVPLNGINIEKNADISNLKLQDLKPIKVECTKEQYDYLSSLTESEHPSKIHFKNSYFNPSDFKLISIG
jgi:uncharacterized protein YjbK